jgi:hypothetical protein
MGSPNKKILYLLILLSFVSCRNQTLPKFESFVNNALSDQAIRCGTSKTWGTIREIVSKTGKPRALLLDHGEESLILRINLIRSAEESILIQTFS